MRAMSCPRGCGSLVSHLYENVEIDICPACGGIWLDQGELQQIQQTRIQTWPRDVISKVLASIRNAGIPAREYTAPPQCLVCGERMPPINYQARSGIIINTCHNGHGVWLDRGELLQIQVYMEHWEDHAERNKEHFDAKLAAIRDHFAARLNPEQAERHGQEGPDRSSKGSRWRKLTAIQLYYLCTPLFLVADMMLGVRFRVAETLEGNYRIYYYIACIGLGVACLVWNKAQRYVVAIESGLNIFLLCLGVLYIDYEQALAGHYRPAIELSWHSAVTFFVSGLVWIYLLRRASRPVPA